MGERVGTKLGEGAIRNSLAHIGFFTPATCQESGFISVNVTNLANLV
jgi:hypothetical protein